MIKAAIFDVDGTVLDSMPVWRETDENYLDSFGIGFDEEVYNKMHAMTVETSFEYFRRAFNLNIPAEKIRADITEIIGKRYAEDVMPVKGMPELIKELYEKDVTLSIATSNRRAFIHPAFERLDLLKYFSYILICDELQTGKHEPKIFNEAAKMMRSSPSVTAVFEDSHHALETAEKAGFIIVNVTEYDMSDAAVRRKLIDSL